MLSVEGSQEWLAKGGGRGKGRRKREEEGGKEEGREGRKEVREGRRGGKDSEGGGGKGKKGRKGGRWENLVQCKINLLIKMLVRFFICLEKF